MDRPSGLHPRNLDRGDTIGDQRAVRQCGVWMNGKETRIADVAFDEGHVAQNTLGLEESV